MLTHDATLACRVNGSRFIRATTAWWIRDHCVGKNNKCFYLSYSSLSVATVPMLTQHTQGDPVSSSATFTTFSVSYSPFAPHTKLGESTSPWSLYGWEHHLLSRCPNQQESWITSFKIFGVGSLISCSAYIFCSNLSTVCSPSWSTFLIHQKHQRLS